MAVIAGLEALTKNNLSIIIYSDSQYVVRAVEEGWLEKWIATNFKGGKKNKDLWLRFYELQQKNRISFKWVKGHAENVHNNRCDELATAAADGDDLLVDEEFEKENWNLHRICNCCCQHDWHRSVYQRGFPAIIGSEYVDYFIALACRRIACFVRRICLCRIRNAF